MNIKEINKIYSRIVKLVVEQKLIESFELLNSLNEFVKDGAIQNEAETLKTNYSYLLKYTITGSSDPERHNVYRKLQTGIIKLADKLKQSAYINSTEMSFFKNKKRIQNQGRLTEEEAEGIIEKITIERELKELLSNSDITGDSEPAINSSGQIFSELFFRFWLTDKFLQNDYTFLLNLLKSERVYWYEKSLLTTSITLSFLNYFDPLKLKLLIDIYKTNDIQSGQRALVGIIIGLLQYDNRLALYPEFINEIKVLQDENGFFENFQNVIYQLARARDTEKLSKRLQEEILPEVIKNAPKISEKLDIENILSHDLDDDKNPRWKTVFQDTPDLYKKMEEISNLQMEGSDVFMSAFKMLKNFPFFSDTINWFLPFHSDNNSIVAAFKDNKHGSLATEFLNSMVKAPYLCNSDKYSFCLNMRNMPETQLPMLMELFVAETNSLNELNKEDDKLNRSASKKVIIAQYIQDLYRFYKLSPMKNQLEDIFLIDMDFYNKEFFKNLITDKKIFRNIAEFYFEKEHFDDSLAIYSQLEETESTDSELFQKIGYCYYQIKDFRSALEYFKKADIIDSGNLWTLKKIALCYRKLKEHEKALEYYLEAEKKDPESLYLMAFIGHCYLDLKNYDQALKYYFKVEYLSPNNHKVLRPIAWISFISGKLDVAMDYYGRIPVTELNKFDYVNIGHLFWCTSNRQEACNYYRDSINKAGLSLELFEKTFNDDKEFLSSRGIDTEEFPIMLDFLKYSLHTNS